MTYREKLEKELPKYIRPGVIAGIKGCPHDYFNIPDNVKPCGIHQTVNNAICSACWDREVPEEDTQDAYKKALENMGKTAQESAAHLANVTGAIKDSGERRQFETGAVRDIQEGKGRCDLMPLEVVADILGDGECPDPHLSWITEFQKTGETKYLTACLMRFGVMSKAFKTLPTMLLEVAKHFEEGAKKYGENNWQKGLPANCYIDSAVRHYLKWLRGDKDEPHDRAFVWNLMCCIWEVDFSPRAVEAQDDIVLIRFEDCPLGMFEYDGATYVKADIVDEIDDNIAINVTTGVNCSFDPNDMVRPLIAEEKELTAPEGKPGGGQVTIEETVDEVYLGDCPAGMFEYNDAAYIKPKYNHGAVVQVLRVNDGEHVCYPNGIRVRPMKMVNANEDEGESTAKRSETVHYICDRRACNECANPDCKHTSDIQHAANFEKIGGAYFEKEKPEEVTIDIHVGSAWIRLGNCPYGLVEIDGVVYVKTAALISKTNDIAVVNVTNGVMTALHPDIYARPLEAIKSEDYNRAWNQKGGANE